MKLRANSDGDLGTSVASKVHSISASYLLLHRTEPELSRGPLFDEPVFPLNDVCSDVEPFAAGQPAWAQATHGGDARIAKSDKEPGLTRAQLA